MRKRRIVQNAVVCPSCGQKIEFWRYATHQHKAGHRKPMWCPFCKKRQKMIEIKKEQRNLLGENIDDVFNGRRCV